MWLVVNRKGHGLIERTEPIILEDMRQLIWFWFGECRVKEFGFAQLSEITAAKAIKKAMYKA